MAGKQQEFTLRNEVTGEIQVLNILNKEKLSKTELDMIFNCEDMNVNDF
jgi:hypothetical protein